MLAAFGSAGKPSFMSDAAVSKAKSSVKFTAMTARLTIAGLITLAGIAMFQDRLLYFPAKATQADMVSEGLRAWPTPQDFRGLVAEPVAPCAAPPSSFTAMPDMLVTARSMPRRSRHSGLRVILAEYPGYGPRDGPVGEQNLVADAEQTIALAHSLYGAPVLLIGESLGAAVAAAAAARQRDKRRGCCSLRHGIGSSTSPLTTIRGYR